MQPMLATEAYGRYNRRFP